MNYIIRNYKTEDLDEVFQMDQFLGLSIQYNGDYKAENIFCLVDKEDHLHGIGCLILDATWYVIDEIDTIHLMNYKIQLNENITDTRTYESILMDRLIERIKELKTIYPTKTLGICSYCEDKDISDMEFLLSKSFEMSGVVPVFKYQLSKEIPSFELPEYIKIKEYQFTDGKAMANYQKANKDASDGIADSEPELWFRTGAPEFKCYVATAGDEIVGAISTWFIDEGHSATENIFVIKEYRRKNIAKKLITVVLTELKDNDKQIATLSTKGTNKNAIKLYQSLGYELFYNLVEMHYVI